MSEQKTTEQIWQSIKTRLNNKARERGQNYNTLLQRYIAERFLYRLSQSTHADKLILKGGMLLIAWQGDKPRVTQDIDFLSPEITNHAEMQHIFAEICQVNVIADGMDFLHKGIETDIIKEGDPNYPGLRIKIPYMMGGKIANRQNLQVDIGFSDAVTPNVEDVNYPTPLDLPAPKLRAYPLYTVLAEKFEALVHLDEGNSRLKDFYDIWFVVTERTNFDKYLDGTILAQAIKNTFEHRKTDIRDEIPIALTQVFYANDDKQKNWQGFLKDRVLMAPENLPLEQVVIQIRDFMMPVYEALARGETFDQVWDSTQWEKRDNNERT